MKRKVKLTLTTETQICKANSLSSQRNYNMPVNNFCLQFFLYFTGYLLCPVKTFELYMTRLSPHSDLIWQKPLETATWDDRTWFEPTSLSKNKIGGLMSTLLKTAKLTKTYTNHCIRKTVITVLDHSGFEACDIMTVSGHKKVETIQNYSGKTPKTKKRAMSNALSTAMCPEKVPKKEAPVMTRRFKLPTKPTVPLSKWNP